VIATLVEEDGSQVFDPGAEDDLMASMPVGTLMRLQTAALRVNRATEDVQQEKNG